MKKLTPLALFISFSFLFSYGCGDDDDPNPCEIFCEEMTDCSELLDQPFSRTRCERDCRDDLESYGLVNCDDDFLDLIECRSNLACSELNDVGDKCADEIDDLNRCLD